MAKSLVLPFYVGDAVVVNARAGTVDQVTLRASDVLYYVATTDDAGRHYSDYFPEGSLSAPTGASSGPFLSSIEYFDLFTEAEQDAIFAPSVPAAVRRAVAFATAAGIIDMADPVVIAGIDGLVAAGLLAADRAPAVKAATPPVTTAALPVLSA